MGPALSDSSELLKCILLSISYKQNWLHLSNIPINHGLTREKLGPSLNKSVVEQSMADEQNHSFFMDQSWHFTTQLFHGCILCLSGLIRHPCLVARAAGKSRAFSVCFQTKHTASPNKILWRDTEKATSNTPCLTSQSSWREAWKCVIYQAPR